MISSKSDENSMLKIQNPVYISYADNDKGSFLHKNYTKASIFGLFSCLEP